MTRYQWLVLAAAWLGWGFDVFDALLFNFVAPNTVPTLLGLDPGGSEARDATVLWTGILSSILLVGWAAGGILFGWYADRYGRRRALFVTVSLYAIGTALCAASMNMGQLVVFRAIASLGIGGEWAVGAALVAETLPENRRVFGGTLLYTASPIGLLLAGLVNYQVAGVWFADDPANSWRYVFLCGLAPVALAFAVRAFIHDPEAWAHARAHSAPPSPRELFTPEVRRATLVGTLVSVAGLLTWWACNAFVPLLGAWLAVENAPGEIERWKTIASNAFNLGGLVGALAALPLAYWLGRRAMFAAYFVYSAFAIVATFGLEFAPELRIRLLFFVGLGVYGIFSTYVFYLPELFPARLRASGAGFCYNIGRVVAAAGPLAIGIVTSAADGSSAALLGTMIWVAVIPFAAAMLTPLVIETRGMKLQ
ncbi:MAG TPA: MFS transporter [Steroidobacteraceae bacterium]|nr:MFS transporter [Steroidobacteraceae bacterium]HNS27031.1 MFS transporter [Steroidobacteraceae bacterium]